jgi:sulfur carrier protein ThiS
MSVPITFKLYASLMAYLPPMARGHAVALEVEEGTTPVQLLERFGVPLAEVHLVLVNGVFLPPSRRERPLEAGDVLAVWPAVAGG